MKLKSMQIKNFRCFSDLTIDFDDRLTVLVGTNGSGKTAVLDAIAYLLDELAWEIIDPNSYCKQLPITDRYYGTDKMELNYSVALPPSNGVMKWPERIDLPFLFKENKLSETLVPYGGPSNPNNLYVFQRIYAGTNKGNLPILVYYGAKRIAGKNEDGIFSQKDKKNIYKNAFAPQIDFSTSAAWFINKRLEETNEAVEQGNLDFRMPDITAVRKAVAKALSGIDNVADDFNEPFVKQTPPRIFITRKSAPDVPLSVEQLSDGYRVMLALVMDLARRMAAANENVKWPEGQTVLHSPAVVLIDEVEKHLHPGWQQTVLPKLMGIFPNAQFIVTTHSPQVLSSISGKHVRVLKGEKVYGLADVDETEGAESSRVLRNVLGISPRPQGNRYTKKLSRYKELVYNEKWDTPEAENLRSELDAHFHDAEPEMDELKLHIENSQWERQLEAEEGRSKA